MKVILKRDVRGLGREGELKEVKSGYARNFLIPTGAVQVADAGALKNWQRHRTEREDRERALLEEAEAMAEKLRAIRLEVGVKAGEKNRLFGSWKRETAGTHRQPSIHAGLWHPGAERRPWASAMVLGRGAALEVP